MYSIGEFSRITGLTVKALRLYHEKGIVIPSHVDHSSGYRYYSQADTDNARRVITLKIMRCSLAEIQQVMADYSDDADLIEFLKTKQGELQAEMNKLTEVSVTINTLLQRESEVRQMTQHTYQIEIKTLNDLQMVSTRWKGSYRETGKILGKLYRKAGRHSNGAALTLCYDDEYRELDADMEVCVPVSNSVDDCKTLPGGRFITLIHKGPYETMGNCFARVFDYAREQNLPLSSPSRMVYLKGPGMIFKGNPEKYLTEIQFSLID